MPDCAKHSTIRCIDTAARTIAFVGSSPSHASSLCTSPSGLLSAVILESAVAAVVVHAVIAPVRTPVFANLCHAAAAAAGAAAAVHAVTAPVAVCLVSAVGGAGVLHAAVHCVPAALATAAQPVDLPDPAVPAVPAVPAHHLHVA